MKERPILFSAPMVRAILEGRKTQTRRVVASQMAIEDIERMAICHPILGDAKRVGSMKVDREMVGCMCGGELTETDIVRLWCRHGVPGDRLWVKEKWRPAWHPEMFCSVQYAADSSYHKPTITDETRGHRFADACEQSGDHAEPWHPSIHMWREFSRITLEVVSVRVQRLQEISEEDAVAEGLDPCACESVFDAAVGRAKSLPRCYIETEDGTDCQLEWCPKCAERESRKLTRTTGVKHTMHYDSGETDAPRWCETCAALLMEDMSLTDYGIERELYLENDSPGDRPSYAARGEDAIIARGLANSVSQVQQGRLAQIAYATLWDSINGSGAWRANPWVWVIEFKRIEARP